MKEVFTGTTMTLVIDSKDLEVATNGTTSTAIELGSSKLVDPTNYATVETNERKIDYGKWLENPFIWGFFIFFIVQAIVVLINRPTKEKGPLDL